MLFLRRLMLHILYSDGKEMAQYELTYVVFTVTFLIFSPLIRIFQPVKQGNVAP